MKIGTGSYTYPWWVKQQLASGLAPLDVSLRLAEKAYYAEMDIVQLCDNCDIHLLEDGELEQLGKRCAEMGLILELGTRGVSFAHMNDMLDKAERCGSRFIRTMLPSLDGSEPSLEEAGAELKKLTGRLEKYEVRIGIENHDKHSSEVIADFTRALGCGFIGVCLDTVNSFAALETPDIVISNLLPLANNIHYKDFAVVRANEQMGFSIEGRPAGEGMLNADRLIASGINTVIELWPPFRQSLEATVELEGEWAEKSVVYLKKLRCDVTA